MPTRLARRAFGILLAVVLALGAAGTSAARASSPTISARAYSAVVGKGQDAVVIGSVSHVSHGTVRLERLVGAVWQVQVSGALAAEGGSFALPDQEPVGLNVLRVVLVGHPGVTSDAVRVRVTSAAALAAANRLDAWGASEVNPQSSIPLRVPGLKGVAQIVSGVGDQTVALMIDGTLRVWGFDKCVGVPGNGATPETVPHASAVIMVALNFCQGIALRADGTLWWWGDTSAFTVPGPFRQWSGLTDVVAIAGGFWNAHALLRNGTVVSWGDNPDEFGGTATRNQPYGPTKVAGLSHVISIAASVDDTVYALLADRTVRAFGGNEHGQLGNGTKSVSSNQVLTVRGLHDVVALAASDTTGFALLGDGGVRAWGNGEALGDGVGHTSTVPVTVVGLKHVTKLSAGGHTAYAVTRDGRVWAWGVSTLGQLGDGIPGLPMFKHTAVKPQLVLGLTHPLVVASGDSAAYAMVG